MLEIYDRDGNPVLGSFTEVMSWYNEKLGDREYKFVETTKTDDFVISTIWLGMDHNYLDEGSPLIFETMIFQRAGWDDRDSDDPNNIGMLELACNRYSTEDQARNGHEELVFWVAHDPEYFHDQVKKEIAYKAKWASDVED